MNDDEDESNMLINPYEHCYSYWNDVNNIYERIAPTQSYMCCKESCEDNKDLLPLDECTSQCEKLRDNNKLTPEFMQCVKNTGCKEQFLKKDFRGLRDSDFKDYANCISNNREKVMDCCRKTCPTCSCEELVNKESSGSGDSGSDSGSSGDGMYIMWLLIGLVVLVMMGVVVMEVL